MKNKVLITGGAGFIGSRLAITLLEKKYDVTIIDNLSPQIHGVKPEKSPLFNMIKDKVHFIKGDVTDYEDMKQSLENIDIVIHLAAETGTGQSMYEIKRYTDVNVGGTALLLDLITNTENHISKVIVASSRAVYGEGKYQCPTHGVVYPDYRNDLDMANKDFELHCPICNSICKVLPTDENSPLVPSSIYGITKQNQEQMVLTVCKSLGIQSIAYRFQNVYGPGQSLSNPYTGILSIFSNRLRNGNGIEIYEDGNESRDFVFIDDIVKSIVLGIEAEDFKSGAYNVGTGVGTDVITVAQEICNNLKIDIPYKITGNYRVGDIRHNIADLSRIEKEFGYKPSVFFKEGIKLFIDWVKTESVYDDMYEKSINELKAKGLYK